jgi:hypothetical protein
MLSHLCLAHGDDHAHKVDVLSQSHRFAEALAKLAAEEN